MILYETPYNWSLKYYLACKCWDGGSGLDKLESNGIVYKITDEKNGIQLARDGHTTTSYQESILVGWEPPLNCLTAYTLKNEPWLGKIFTSIQPDGKHITTPNPIICESVKKLKEKTKFACMVASNKTSSWRNSLYDKRLEIINEGKKYNGSHPLIGFDLYGMGWSQNIPCYKGELPWDRNDQSNLWSPKVRKMSEYKFAFVTENCEMEGYITEKIINALAAGCVPLYQGATDIEKYVPMNCFIDLRKISIKDSFILILNISEKEYEDYYNNILDFMQSSNSYYLSSYYIADQIIDILKENNLI